MFMILFQYSNIYGEVFFNRAEFECIDVQQVLISDPFVQLVFCVLYFIIFVVRVTMITTNYNDYNSFDVLFSLYIFVVIFSLYHFIIFQFHFFMNNLYLLLFVSSDRSAPLYKETQFSDFYLAQQHTQDIYIYKKKIIMWNVFCEI